MDAPRALLVLGVHDTDIYGAADLQPEMTARPQNAR
jgi:hypothetical protein